MARVRATPTLAVCSVFRCFEPPNDYNLVFKPVNAQGPRRPMVVLAISEGLFWSAAHDDESSCCGHLESRVYAIFGLGGEVTQGARCWYVDCVGSVL